MSTIRNLVYRSGNADANTDANTEEAKKQRRRLQNRVNQRVRSRSILPSNRRLSKSAATSRFVLHSWPNKPSKLLKAREQAGGID